MRTMSKAPTPPEPNPESNLPQSYPDRSEGGEAGGHDQGQERRALPQPKRPAGKAGNSQLRHKRWRRIATLATIAFLVGFVILALTFFQGSDQEVEATSALLDDLAGALDSYHEKTGTLPERISQLVGPDSPYRGSPLPEDAWRRAIEYRAVDVRGGIWRLRSLGADGVAGNADDLIWPKGKDWPVP